jgi:cytoskeleton protein RodZ
VTEIGGTLREARMRRGIEIIEAERATKIRAKYLRAMEDEEWSLLPGPTFVKSFLRTYGDYLGVDSRLLVEEWKRRNERESENDFPPLAARGGRSGGRSARPPREPPPWRGPVAVGAVLILILVGLGLIGTLTKPDEPAPTSTSTAPRTSTGKKGRAQAKARATRVRLQLSALAPVYVCLVDGSGKRLVNGVNLEPGRPTRTFTARVLRLNLGNAEVRLRVNGRRVAVPPSGAGIGYEFTPKGRRSLPAGRRPTCTA